MRSADRRAGALFGELHLDAVLHVQRPAPAGDEDPGFDARSEIAEARKKTVVFGHANLRSLAHHERQSQEFFIVQFVDDFSVGVDDVDRPVLLPQGVWLTFLDRDDQPVRIKLEHPGALDQRQLHHLPAHLGSVEKRQGVAGAYAGGGQHVGLGHFLVPGDGDGRNLEADGAGDDVAKGSVLRDEFGVASPLQEAGAADQREERRDGDEADAGPGQENGEARYDLATWRIRAGAAGLVETLARGRRLKVIRTERRRKAPKRTRDGCG